jgi:hypothetical protein
MDAHQANLVLTGEGIVPIDIPVFRGSADRDIAQWRRRVGVSIGTAERCRSNSRWIKVATSPS